MSLIDISATRDFGEREAYRTKVGHADDGISVELSRAVVVVIDVFDRVVPGLLDSLEDNEIIRLQLRLEKKLRPLLRTDM